MSLPQTAVNSNTTSLVVTKRTAIDPSGRLGSLYDGYQDRLLGQLKLNSKHKSNKESELRRCEIIHCSKHHSQNILKLVNIQEELCLSILLNLTEKNGTAAIIDYSHTMNECTRLFYYSYVDQIQRLPDRAEDAYAFINLPTPQTKATHIITGVDYGVDAVVVLQLPYDEETRNELDRVLQQLCTFLLSDYNTYPLISDNDSTLKRIIHTKVHSNIPELKSMTTLHYVCRYIEQNKNSTVNYPISYTLRPIKWLYPLYTGEGTMFVPLPSALHENIEQYVLQITSGIKKVKFSLKEDLPKLLCGHLKEKLSNLQKQCLDVKNKYTNVIQRFSKLVIQGRSGKIQMSVIDKELKDNDQTTMQNDIRDLTQNFNDLKEKGHLISDLARQQFHYYNVAEHDIDRSDNEKTIERKLVMDNTRDRVLCSNDALNKIKPEQLHQLRCDLVEELKRNSSLRLIYADFSYCSFELHNMMRLPSSKYNNAINKTKKIGTSSSKEIQTSAPTPTKAQATVPLSTREQTSIPAPIKIHTPIEPLPSLPTEDIINVLLLGETGVGKSTFINAFVNYLTFRTLGQARSQKPVVLIPVSFLITVGDKFEEHTVKFGGLDSSSNEDFDHPGQSVTQHCKSYVFPLDYSDGRKLRIIDTPGFGDTRGVDQDDLNMQHILDYIHNLTHLNAICFLLKPNESRLNIFFRTCLTQLSSLLGPNMGDKVIFCFTNARSTFFTPGNTGSLLKKMLASLLMGDVPFEKKNTFCFDNESFRYFVALQNKITFSNEEKQEYEKSWSISVTESNRLIDYIRKNLISHILIGELQSIKHAQLEIVRMIRPMLEAMRNILRNLILCSMGRTKESIELYAKSIHRPATICFVCKPYPHQVGNFWIVRDLPHEIQNNCRSCQCPLNQHILIDYVLEYKLLNNSSKYNQNQMTEMLHQLCQASAEFSHFLMHVAHSSKEDPFMSGLNRMIREEVYLNDSQNPKLLNLQLVETLKKLKSNYEKNMNVKFPNVYEWIQCIREHPMVCDQIIAVKQTHAMIMKQYEYEVRND